ncbi:hypothetical protein GQ53DRAFT_721982 [Thozetella sp. PMI_491]|nr:hypothetical protein GQ53DRAFT_721982 [Thozetella sp. PMI_491]
MAQLGLPSISTSRPGSSYSAFNLSSRASSPSDQDDDDDAPLPFPTALSRRDFMAPDFDPATYLSSLHSGPTARHQTLEDLRTELRDRSGAISAELLELVNSNYTSFLSLGDELKGGEEKVEDLRVGLMGFRRAVEEVQSRVRDRKVEVQGYARELGNVKSAVEMGRRMLELDERVSELEGRLALESLVPLKEDKDDLQDDWIAVDASDEDIDDDEADFVGSSPVKLESLAKSYLAIERLAHHIGRDVVFVQKIEERIFRCRRTILLDLSTALKEARKAGPKGQGRTLKFLTIYGVLGAAAEAVQVVKEK